MEKAQGRVGDTLADDTAPDLTETEQAGAPTTGADAGETEPSPRIDPSLLEEASTLIDDARTYAEAELGFQKTRAAFAGKLAGIAAGLGILALILLHIAFLALAVGLVLAFEPLVGIWGAIAIVVGALLLLTGLLGWKAFATIKRLSGLFDSSDETKEDVSEEQAS